MCLILSLDGCNWKVAVRQKKHLARTQNIEDMEMVRKLRTKTCMQVEKLAVAKQKKSETISHLAFSQVGIMNPRTSEAHYKTGQDHDKISEDRGTCSNPGVRKELSEWIQVLTC